MTNIQKGLFAIIAPVVGLVIIVISYSVLTFLAGVLKFAFGAVLSIVLSLFGLLCLIAIPAGIALGIYYIAMGDEKEKKAKK